MSGQRGPSGVLEGWSGHQILLRRRAALEAVATGAPGGGPADW